MPPTEFADSLTSRERITFDAFMNLMKANLYGDDYRFAIALTVIDLIDMQCDSGIVHRTANHVREYYGLPAVRVTAVS